MITIYPVIEKYDGKDITDEKENIMKEIVDELDTTSENIEKSLDKTFKRLGSKLDDIIFHTKAIGESIEESKIADEKLLSDIELIKGKVFKTK